ncbi:hypothetical protein JX265_010353 [Neoarthrinium moseri]|uniref:Glycosyltransferase family 31 protein n=1 Tax=Neoarthrinium moseri TaxID=1658444 RepID=A0A9P9WEA6_9PEZI|nr:uncharacterized protein JN550_012616 [Neoarthrinium moseri]KAI1858483.1 hypothetical protein JN550_012616 [Neoarthrinium moseri]KAI1859350.1 hypothetical protein JX265_010353 [Neoarthrinium moseri]
MMFPSKVPRVFILAGFVLIFLVVGTNYYLFDDEPRYAPATNWSGHVGDDLSQTKTPEDVVVGADVGGVEDPGYLGHSTEPAVAEPIPAEPEAKPEAEPELPINPVPVPDLAPEPEPASTPMPTPTAAPKALDVTPEIAKLPAQPEFGDDNPHPLLPPGECPELEFLERAHSAHNFSSKVRYKQVCIEPSFSADVDRDAVANISERIFGGEVTVNLGDCSSAQLPRCVPIKLQVPQPYRPSNISHFIFGISTDYERLQSEIDTFAHWLSKPGGSGAKLVALVTDYAEQKNGSIHELQQRFVAAGINADIVPPLNELHTVSQSHFSVLTYMYNRSTPATQWYGLLDDDTFFPRGLQPLSDALATLDHKKDVYVGALSEDLQAIRVFGFMAFGGAGAYFSAPLAEKLAKEARTCMEESGDVPGDIIIRDCVYRHSKVKLTILPGLFQQDLRDDVSGFFESGVQPINLHHWKSWYKEPVVEMAAAASYCGDCFLQRFRFGGDTVFTNGYSINRYRYGHKYLDLQTMEGTWSNANKDFDFSIGPVRRKMVPDEKKSYKLADVDFSDVGDFKQLYVWKGNANANEMDGIIEVIWQRYG